MDDVHNLMDEVAEQQEIASEISDAISNPVGFGNDVDEVGDSSRKDFFVRACSLTGCCMTCTSRLTRQHPQNILISYKILFKTFLKGKPILNFT